jgi:hypothetical protein
MFDPQFYSEALPELVLSTCATRLDCSPVVILHLADGSAFELCDVTQISGGWLGVAYHKDGTCSGGDFAFIPHAVVARVTVSLRRSEARTLGFRHATTEQPSAA